MKATGIVRRIDDLGRVVIPKEIRRTLHIREGEPLEIYTNNGGEVIFKKYSPIGELSEFSLQYAESLAKHSDFPFLICDMDHCIAASGISKKEVIDKGITQHLEKVIESHQIKKWPKEECFPALSGVDRNMCVAVPITSSGDAVGAVVILCDENGNCAGEVDTRLAQVGATFLGKQMED